MMRLIKYGVLVIVVLIVAVIGYGGKGYWDAISDTGDLRQRADDLIARGRTGAGLGAEHLAVLLAVQDPSFAKHNGVDFDSPGAGATTITQSLAKRLAFDEFKPGIAKIRQTGYALGLERGLSKEQILALWLDTVEMGQGPDGWMTGFYDASTAIYQRPPAQLTTGEFARLVAVLIAPSSYDLRQGGEELERRTARIERLGAGDCAPLDHGDVWLEGCR